jgi:endonuclease/exonuclease/phosphatase family metal-dependent hydrolase
VKKLKNNHWIKISILWLIFIVCCEPLVDRFDDVEDGLMYVSKQFTDSPLQIIHVRVMTWNIRFGAGRLPWFGDSCGDRVILTDDEVMTHLKGIATKIDEVKPDILLLQEIDANSKRSGYLDQVQWLLDHTYFNYGCYASLWKVQFIPSDGLGRMDMGNAILSRWKITEAERIQLPLRGDQDALTQYFYLRRNILKAKIAVPGVDNFYAVNVHTSAFSTDDTKKKHIDIFKYELDKLNEAGCYFVAGGDLNTLPPGAAKTDYCLENKCPGESFHGPNDNPQHKEGEYFTREVTWLKNLYDDYQEAVPIENYLANEIQYLTHTSIWDGFWQKKLDYLFTNHNWMAGSAITHQEATELSDHTPISVTWEVPQ